MARILKREIHQAQQESHLLLKKALQEQEQQLIQGRQLAELKEQEAYQEGHQKAVELFQAQTHLALEEYKSIYQNAENEVAVLAVAIVEKIVASTLQIPQEEQIKVIKMAMEEEKSASEINIKLMTNVGSAKQP